MYIMKWRWMTYVEVLPLSLPSSPLFLSLAVRLHRCPSVRQSVGRSVDQLVRRSVRPSVQGDGRIEYNFTFGIHAVNETQDGVSGMDAYLFVCHLHCMFLTVAYSQAHRHA